MGDVLVLEEFPDAGVVLLRTTNGRLVVHRTDVESETLCGRPVVQEELTIEAGKRIHLCRTCDKAVRGQARIDRLT